MLLVPTVCTGDIMMYKIITVLEITEFKFLSKR